jgi:hypothetical protein
LVGKAIVEALFAIGFILEPLTQTAMES